jgi:hypothetical protein
MLVNFEPCLTTINDWCKINKIKIITFGCAAFALLCIGQVVQQHNSCVLGHNWIEYLPGYCLL